MGTKFTWKYLQEVGLSGKRYEVRKARWTTKRVVNPFCVNINDSYLVAYMCRELSEQRPGSGPAWSAKMDTEWLQFLGVQLVQMEVKEASPLSLAQASSGLLSCLRPFSISLDGAPLICQFEDGFSVCSTGMESVGK